jgi:hypothetical protein
LLEEADEVAREAGTFAELLLRQVAVEPVQPYAPTQLGDDGSVLRTVSAHGRPSRTESTTSAASSSAVDSRRARRGSKRSATRPGRAHLDEHADRLADGLVTPARRGDRQPADCSPGGVPDGRTPSLPQPVAGIYISIRVPGYSDNLADGRIELAPFQLGDRPEHQVCFPIQLELRHAQCLPMIVDTFSEMPEDGGGLSSVSTAWPTAAVRSGSANAVRMRANASGNWSCWTLVTNSHWQSAYTINAKSTDSTWPSAFASAARIVRLSATITDRHLVHRPTDVIALLGRQRRLGVRHPQHPAAAARDPGVPLARAGRLTPWARHGDDPVL